jgi:hypothetical protein
MCQSERLDKCQSNREDGPQPPQPPAGTTGRPGEHGPGDDQCGGEAREGSDGRQRLPCPASGSCCARQTCRNLHRMYVRFLHPTIGYTLATICCVGIHKSCRC